MGGFFVVEDGQGGSSGDRVAIIAVVALAFCWVPIFLIWRFVSRMRQKNKPQNGNMPVTTNNPDPEKHPFHLDVEPPNIEPPDIQPPERIVPAGHHRRQASRHSGRRK